MSNVKFMTAMILSLGISQSGFSKEEYHSSAKGSADLKVMSNQFWWPERLDLMPLVSMPLNLVQWTKNLTTRRSSKK